MYSATQIELADELQNNLPPKKIILEKGEISELDLPHIFSVQLVSKYKKQSENHSALWLDSGNLFNPYRISEISRKLGENPKQVLKSIFISRAFTCHQMSSLILEKLKNNLKERGAKIITITNLPTLYLNSDLSKKEAAKAFNPIVEHLEKLKEKDVLVLLTASNSIKVQKSEIFQKLNSTAETTIDVTNQNQEITVTLSEKPEKKNIRSTDTPQTPPLEKYVGRA